MSGKSNTTITPILWTRKGKDNLYPIKIRLTKDRKSKYYPLGFSIRKSDWSSLKRGVKTTHPNHNKINHHISLLVAKIEDSQKTKGDHNVDLDSSLVGYIHKLIEQKKQGNKYYSQKRFKTLLKHLTNFWGGDNISFYDLNPNLIEEFRLYLETNVKSNRFEKSPSPNTVNNYLKVLRAIVNRSIQDGVYYGQTPFRNGHIPKKVRTPKITLSRDDIWFLDNLDENRDGLTEGMWNAVNVFLFCFWSQGIRIGDCLQLKFGHLVDGTFEITMDKTERKHRFPLTDNNLFRILNFIDTIPPYYDWENKKHLSLHETDVGRQFNQYPKKIELDTKESEIHSMYTIFVKNRITLYNTLKRGLDSANTNRHIANRVDKYLNNNYSLYDRAYYIAAKEKGGSDELHDFKLYEEYKSLYLKFGRQYLMEYCRRKENRDKFIFPFLNGLENDRTNARWNKISSTTALINKNLKKISELYNIKPFSTHYSRHTFTSLSKEMGADIYDLKNWLGHTSVRTTEGYVNTIGTSASISHNNKLNSYLTS